MGEERFLRDDSLAFDGSIIRTAACATTHVIVTGRPERSAREQPFDPGATV